MAAGHTQPEFPRLQEALVGAGAGLLHRVVLPAGSALVAEGQPADALFAVLRGTLLAAADPASEQTAEPIRVTAGGLVGAMPPFSSPGPGAERFVAETEAEVVRLAPGDWRALAHQAPAAAAELMLTVHRRLSQDRLLRMTTRLLGPLDAEVLAMLRARARWLEVQSGTVLCREGDEDRTLYLVVSGRLRATARDGRTLGEIAGGESIGELSLITGEPRSATVTAIRDCEVVRLEARDFDEIAALRPPLVRRLAAQVVRRLRSREQAADRPAQVRCIAVFPVCARARSSGFASALVRALEPLGATAHLQPERLAVLAAAHGADSPRPSGSWTAWLTEQEAAHRFVVFETDGLRSPWTEQSLRQADMILVVGDAASDPTPGEEERTLLLGPDRISSARQEFVLLNPPGTRLPTGTQRWRQPRNPGACHHVIADDVGHHRRLARSITGAATGVVLGGGGARGLAHIGVLRALVEAKAPIDLVAGTSMGAVIGGAFAMGLGWEEIRDISREGWLRRRPHREYTVPLMSLVRTRRLERWARSIYGDTDIDDLWFDFFCVACNLTTSEMQVLDQGPLWRAVRASSSLPGVFLPTLVDGAVLVDGGLLNNLPGDLARARGCRRVIVVDVSRESGFRCDLDAFPSPGGFLLNLLKPAGRRRRVPSLMATLMRLPVVSSAECARRAKAAADLCLRPPVDAFGVLEFEAIDRIVQCGYDSTRRALDAAPPPWA